MHYMLIMSSLTHTCIFLVPISQYLRLQKTTHPELTNGKYLLDPLKLRL